MKSAYVSKFAGFANDEKKKLFKQSEYRHKRWRFLQVFFISVDTLVDIRIYIGYLQRRFEPELVYRKGIDGS